MVLSFWRKRQYLTILPGGAAGSTSWGGFLSKKFHKNETKQISGGLKSEVYLCRYPRLPDDGKGADLRVGK
jgi:hypothetical protein